MALNFCWNFTNKIISTKFERSVCSNDNEVSHKCERRPNLLFYGIKTMDKDKINMNRFKRIFFFDTKKQFFSHNKKSIIMSIGKSFDDQNQNIIKLLIEHLTTFYVDLTLWFSIRASSLYHTNTYNNE